MVEEFNIISNTLFVPMRGRIYSTENFPNILKDEEALKLKDKLPPEKGTQSQYTLLASAVRSRNMDRYINDFLKTNPEGVIIEIGCGLETTYFRHKNNYNSNNWYSMDLPEVIDYREKLIPPDGNQKLIRGDILTTEWIDNLKDEIGNKHILVISSGLYHYFTKEDVLKSIRNLMKFENVELVFDALNSLGIKGIKKYMKQIGHDDAKMYFYVNDANELAKEIGDNVKLIKEEKYYNETPKEGLDFMTKTSMRVSDLFYMVKMIHLKLK